MSNTTREKLEKLRGLGGEPNAIDRESLTIIFVSEKLEKLS